MLIDALLTFIKAHPHLFTNILSLGICIAAATWLRPPGRLIFIGGVMNLPCFYLIALLEDNYWNPVRMAIGLSALKTRSALSMSEPWSSFLQ